MAELTQNHINKINELRAQTYAYITTYMPEWRQLKWSQYIELYKKRNQRDIPFYQRDILETMLNEGESYEDGLKRAEAGLNWLGRCTKIHDMQEKQLKDMFEDEVAAYDITTLDYPAWPLDTI